MLSEAKHLRSSRHGQTNNLRFFAPLRMTPVMDPYTVHLTFRGNLTFFLKPKSSGGIVERHLFEKSSVKDVIESCGVPHPEIDLILVDGTPVDFAKTLENEVDINVYPLESAPTLFPEKRLQTRDIKRFIADGHLGKLVRDLRLLGLDVLYDRDAEDRQLLERATTEQRVLLTRDRRLLMHRIVEHGCYLRSQRPLEQTLEILNRFELLPLIDPFTRCLRCNAPFEKVEKDAVIDKLEPLTKVYYEQFRRCTGCGQIYWAGSHFSKLQKRIEAIRAASAGAASTNRACHVEESRDIP